MTVFRRLFPLFLCGAAAHAAPMLATNPVIPANLQVTTFATGVNYPDGIYGLPDGSILVATSNPSPGSSDLFASKLQILRFTDANHDGVADGPGAVVYNGATGPATSMAGSGNIVAVASGLNNGGQINLLQAGPGGSLTQVGSLQFSFPPSFWWHDSHAVAVRQTGAGAYELVFNVGSENNVAPSTQTVSVSGLASGTLNPDSLYRLPFTVSGNSATAGSLTQIATGLRNAFGLGLTANGNLYIGDNGFEDDAENALSADELNFIAAGTSGVVNFGFPGTYIHYPDGVQVGTTGTQPLVSFLPIAGARSEGVTGLAFAPSSFPSGLNNGLFLGFHGFGSVAGTGNPENPVVYVDLATNTYFHFLLGGQPGQGHLDSLFSTNDALYVADLSTADFDTAGSGVIYRIALADVPEPGTMAPAALALVLLAIRRLF